MVLFLITFPLLSPMLIQTTSLALVARHVGSNLAHRARSCRHRLITLRVIIFSMSGPLAMHQAVLGPNIAPAYLQPPVRGGNLNFPEVLEQLASIMTVVDSWIVQIKASSFTEPIRNLLEDFALELTLNMSEVESYKFNLGTLPEFHRARVARGTHALHGGRDGRHEQPPQLGVPSDQPAHLRSTGSAQIMQVA